jgi:hypothetical protein
VARSAYPEAQTGLNLPLGLRAGADAPSRWPWSPCGGSCSPRFCGSSRNCVRDLIHPRHERPAVMRNREKPTGELCLECPEGLSRAFRGVSAHRWCLASHREIPGSLPTRARPWRTGRNAPISRSEAVLVCPDFSDHG